MDAIQFGNGWMQSYCRSIPFAIQNHQRLNLHGNGRERFGILAGKQEKGADLIVVIIGRNGIPSLGINQLCDGEGFIIIVIFLLLLIAVKCTMTCQWRT